MLETTLKVMSILFIIGAFILFCFGLYSSFFVTSYSSNGTNALCIGCASLVASIIIALIVWLGGESSSCSGGYSSGGGYSSPSRNKSTIRPWTRLDHMSDSQRSEYE